MRAPVGVCLTALLASAPAAQSQVGVPLEVPPSPALERCAAEHREQPNPRRFCDCWVKHWLSLWDANDFTTWQKTGKATPHMEKMEKQAYADCDGK